MKNFLIPTTLKEDTICAVKSAINQAKDASCEIILTIISETPDTFSSSQFLRVMQAGLTAAQENVLDQCRIIIANSEYCKLKVHNQYGLSSPIFRRIIDVFSIKLVILTHSYKQETKRIHQFCVQLAANQKCPILHLGNEQIKDDFNKALYIENTTANTHIKDIQQFLTHNFYYEIVSQTTNHDNDYKDFAPQLTEAITKYNIDLLIQTRKAEKIKFKKKKKEDINELLGLPVLSLYEEFA